MNGLNVMITISKYWKQWSNPQLIVMVLNNQDLNQVTWEERVQLGAGKTESTQSIPDLAYHTYAELLGLKGIVVRDPEQIGAGLGRGAGGRPAGDPEHLHRPERAAAAAAHHAEGREELHDHDGVSEPELGSVLKNSAKRGARQRAARQRIAAAAGGGRP